MVYVFAAICAAMAFLQINHKQYDQAAGSITMMLVEIATLAYWAAMKK